MLRYKNWLIMYCSVSFIHVLYQFVKNLFFEDTATEISICIVHFQNFYYAGWLKILLRVVKNPFATCKSLVAKKILINENIDIGISEYAEFEEKIKKWE